MLIIKALRSSNFYALAPNNVMNTIQKGKRHRSEMGKRCAWYLGRVLKVIDYVCETKSPSPDSRGGILFK